ncbi:uncharacterized protein LOC117171297 isoform X4 [Belonocnema kinseyi]|uniref:uncharacterized protein LOC117171297 isoform X4 n=1 Tax=Belonocnema kinseyi TaxID=2817044 RepID=UPI00143D5996|nr:uncharacterized protein LOC117171297 isoform X4 [Belonocnema kinseyi]
MIGSFWNLCRACPSMPIDKLHSEYRSTYTWHEYKGPHQEAVVRRPPQAPSTKQTNAKLQSTKSTEDENSEGPTLEPPLPRRKKCPELAYRTHEFINAADGGGIDGVDSNVVADKVREVTATSTIPSSQLSKAISRISTEYRLQFAWPRRQQLTNGEVAPPVAAAGSTGPPRKSLSMGALKQGIQSGPAPVHRKRPGDIDHKRDGAHASELEPLVGANAMDTIDGVVLEGDEHEEDLPDLKVSFSRSVTKEEKEKENTMKVAPASAPVTIAPAGRPSSVQARPIHGILSEDLKMDNEKAIARARRDFLIRHHLDRTTGVGDGALLPSPTREKLEPVIPRRRDDSKEHRDEIQPRMKSSPKNSPRTGRSQSLGPSVADRKSPKRQQSRAPSVTKDAKEKEKESKDKDQDSREKSGERERHPRPMTAEPHVNGDTTGGSSVASTPPSQVAAPASTVSPWIDDEPVVKSPPEPTRVKSPEQMIMRSPEPVNWTVPLDTGKTFTVTQNVREGEPLTRPHSEAKSWGPSSLPQSAPPEWAQHKSHHSQHSGYKSPESESVSLGSFSGTNGHKDPDSDRGSPLPVHVQWSPTPTKHSKHTTDEEEDTDDQKIEPSIKTVAGTNLRCLEDPVFEFDRKKDTVLSTSTIPAVAVPGQQGYRVLEAEPPQISGSGYHVLEAPAISPGASQRSAATDVLEMARNRFDKFWGKGPEN